MREPSSDRVPHFMFERAPDERTVMNAQRSILVIEDERRIADLIARGLIGAGYAVDAIPDGTDGLERSRSAHYVGVVLDLLLPDADGFELLQELVGEKPGRPVVVVSGLSEADAKPRCLELGAADYVVKPFSVMELVERIRARVEMSVGPGAVSCASVRSASTWSGGSPTRGTVRCRCRATSSRCSNVSWLSPAMSAPVTVSFSTCGDRAIGAIWSTFVWSG
jgi:CheY-like chemotaxis protein